MDEIEKIKDDLRNGEFEGAVKHYAVDFLDIQDAFSLSRDEVFNKLSEKDIDQLACFIAEESIDLWLPLQNSNQI